MQKRPNSKQDYRLAFIIIFCAVSGAILNSSTAWAETIQCQQGENPTTECVRKSPVISAIAGSCMGIMAGTGAALGAVCKRFF